MAGRGSRFESERFEMPKPLIPIYGKPMIYWALKSLRDIAFTEVVVIVLENHETRWKISRTVHDLLGSAVRLVQLPEVTQGQLCTVLAARDYISRDEDLLIASSDTYVVSNLGNAIINRRKTCRGLISVANMPGDRWSFASTNSDGCVTGVAEKIRISDHASTGLYYFSNGGDFLEAADEMICESETIRGEYYVIPVYDIYIKRSWRVEIDTAHEVWDMGTPQSKLRFEQHLSRELTETL